MLAGGLLLIGACDDEPISPDASGLGPELSVVGVDPGFRTNAAAQAQLLVDG